MKTRMCVVQIPIQSYYSGSQSRVYDAAMPETSEGHVWRLDSSIPVHLSADAVVMVHTYHEVRRERLTPEERVALLGEV